MAEQIAQNEMGSDSSQALNSLTWPEQIEYIMELEYDIDDENVIMDLKRLYNHINKRTYDYDLNRYNYLYLTHTNTNILMVVVSKISLSASLHCLIDE
jgi:hypothetical protein